MTEPRELPPVLRGNPITHKCTGCGGKIVLTVDGGVCDIDQSRYLGACDKCRLHYAVVITTFEGVGINQ